MKIGLYEQVINEYINNELKKCDKFHIKKEIDSGESFFVLAKYLFGVISESLDFCSGDNKLEQQFKICNSIINLLSEKLSIPDIKNKSITSSPDNLLLEVLEKNFPHYDATERPDIPLSVSGLLTGTRLEPSMQSQLRKELMSADNVDILCSFIKWSGIRILCSELEDFTARGGHIRIITTSYCGATDPKAIEYLSGLQNVEVKISYDTHRTRLHAKSYIFHRNTGFSSAYIGSANISKAALTDGLEWNIKLSQYETPHLWDKITNTFETYWNDPEFEDCNKSNSDTFKKAIEAERSKDKKIQDFYLDIRPYAFQQEILDKIEAERQYQQRSKFLVVSATGTGKTMIAAFDYKNWSNKLVSGKRPRLLFIAHRKEILEQSLHAFRAVLRDYNFGELMVDGHVPQSHEHLFVSIQSYNSKELWDLPVNYFDYVVVDEFHHSMAESYKKLLSVIKPKVLMGLTATPERMDGQDVTQWFDGHITSQIRLPDAINRRLLCPFQYFGVSDSVNLRDVKWQKGGYVISELENVYNSNKLRTALIIDKLSQTLLDVKNVRGLAFCVSVKHAEYMAEMFNSAGIPSEALSAESLSEDRRTIKKRLVAKEINFIFTVDLFNEGVDIPEIDTVLFLRPTESLTVFLQQLGRGLRLSQDKECLTVLDFIGQANEKYRFDYKFRSLLEDSDRSVQKEIKNDFPHLPSGCSIILEQKAKEYILDNIKRSLRNTTSFLVEELKNYAEHSNNLTIGSFLEYSHLDIDDIYKRNLCWSRLKVLAGLENDFNEPDEQQLTKGLRRLQYIDGPQYIKTLQKLISGDGIIRNSTDEFYAVMSYYTILGTNVFLPANAQEYINRLKQNPHLCSDIIELLDYNLENINTVAPELKLPYQCPLELHCNYSRDEILAAMGYIDTSGNKGFMAGVLELKTKNTDIFFITLNKTEHEYSPSTMYKDYAINDRLFHWQSQSRTTETSSTGQRYINHKSMGCNILLFVRESRNGKNGATSPYYFLGPADYVSHEGSQPISIIWKLRTPMPAKLVRKTARLASI